MMAWKMLMKDSDSSDYSVARNSHTWATCTPFDKDVHSKGARTLVETEISTCVQSMGNLMLALRSPLCQGACGSQ